jgi:hypothetical protein
MASSIARWPPALLHMQRSYNHPSDFIASTVRNLSPSYKIEAAKITQTPQAVKITNRQPTTFMRPAEAIPQEVLISWTWRQSQDTVRGTFPHV